MSKFTTTIPINIEAVKAKLPPRAFVHSVKMGEDKTSLVMTWDSDIFRSKFECVEFPVEMIESGSFPKEVTLIRTIPVAAPKQTEAAKEVGVENKEVAIPAIKRNKKQG